QRMDGIVYAVCVSLGFAALENVMYLLGSYDEWVSVGISRALTAVPGHFGFGVLMGYYYSLGKFDSQNFASAKYKALIVPIIVHGLYDFICFMMGIVPAIAAIIMIVFIVFCAKLWKYGSKRIKEHLERDLKNFT
ncbi:MAG: PrsW family intramembrane metalloprotease, partial [Bacteroides sp]|nr:PrsW family intramembrane metalloprotease [Bacteroides sp.]